MGNYTKYEVEVYSNGSKYWCLNDKLHREDGPAFENASGDKYWYLNNNLHREDGPAVEYANGNKAWWLNDKYYTESEHKAEMARRNNTCDGKTVTVDGKEYTLHEVKK